MARQCLKRRLLIIFFHPSVDLQIGFIRSLSKTMVIIFPSKSLFGDFLFLFRISPPPGLKLRVSLFPPVPIHPVCELCPSHGPVPLTAVPCHQLSWPSFKFPWPLLQGSHSADICYPSFILQHCSRLRGCVGQQDKTSLILSTLSVGDAVQFIHQAVSIVLLLKLDSTDTPSTVSHGTKPTSLHNEDPPSPPSNQTEFLTLPELPSASAQAARPCGVCPQP